MVYGLTLMAPLILKVFPRITKLAQEISISDFMQGLESLLGTDLDGPPRDLDVSLSLGF